MMLQYAPLKEGQSKLARVGWCSILYMEAMLKIASIMLTCLICALSTNLIEILGNAFGILVLAEFSTFSCNMVYVSIENHDLALSKRDDFMAFNVDRTTMIAIEFYDDISFFLYMPASYFVQWNRYDLWWFIGPSPWYVKLCFGGSLTAFGMFPIFAVLIEKWVEWINAYEEVVAEEDANPYKE